MTGETAMLWPAGGTILFGLAGFLLGRHAGARAFAALSLLAVLAGFYALFVVLAPAAPGNDALAATLFLGSLAVFRLMNRFEARS